MSAVFSGRGENESEAKKILKEPLGQGVPHPRRPRGSLGMTGLFNLYRFTSPICLYRFLCRQNLHLFLFSLHLKSKLFWRHIGANIFKRP